MRWLSKVRFRFVREQKGIGLLEVVVAAAILGLIGVGFLAALNTNSKATGALDERVTAANLVADYLEVISNSAYDTEPPYYDDDVDHITIPFQYKADINVECSINSDGTEFGPCTGSETLQKITVTVSREGEHILSICTYKAKR